MDTQTTKALKRTELGFSTANDAEHLRAQIRGLESAIAEKEQEIKEYQATIDLLLDLLLATIEGAIPDE